MGCFRSGCRSAVAACGLLAASAGLAVPPFQPGGDLSLRIIWTRTFASPGDDWINDLVALRDGRVLAVGFLDRNDAADAAANDWRALAAVLQADGEIDWSREYGAGSGIDAFWSATEAADGRLSFAGFTTRIGAGGIDALAVEAGADGAMLSEAARGEPGYDRFTDLAPTGEGVVRLGHSQPVGETRRRLFAVKSDREGQVLWERIIDGAESLAALYIEPAGDGGFIVAGGIGRGEDSDLLVMKLDDEGREVWRRTIGTPDANDVNHGLAVLPDGRIVVVGYSRSWGARDNDILAATLSPAGEVLRREMIGGVDDDRPILARADAQGRVWIVGATRSAGAGDSDLVVARLGTDGAFEPGVLTLGAGGDDHGTAILPLADGSVLVAGYSDALGQGGQDAFVARLSGAGWDRPHPSFTRREIR